MEAEYTKSLILLFSFTFICPFFLPIFSRNSHFPLITLIWFFIFNLKIWFVNMATFTYISSNYCISIRRFFSELAILQICFVNINKQFYNTLSKWISLEIGNFVFFCFFFLRREVYSSRVEKIFRIGVLCAISRFNGHFIQNIGRLIIDVFISIFHYIICNIRFNANNSYIQNCLF